MRQSVPCEIIVVDDGSKIPHKEALLPYMPRIKIISTTNRGVSAARNTGAAEAKGQYIAFLDSDDLFLKNKLERQLKFMRKTACRVSHTDEFWYKTDRFINQGKAHTKYGGRILGNILDKCRISPSSLMLERDLFLSMGGFDENLRVCEDYELSLRLALHHEIAFLNEKHIIKRAITGNSLSASIKHIESIRLTILERFAAENKFAGEEKTSIDNELTRKRSIVKR